MTFGPSELAQLMREVQATIAVVMLSSIGAGIVLGSIIACCNIIRAKRQGPRPDPPISFQHELGGSLHHPIPNGRNAEPSLATTGFPVTLFRLWIAGSALWLAAWVAINWADYSRPTAHGLSDLVYVLPNATADFYQLNNVFDQFDSGIADNHYKVDFPNRVSLLVHNTVPKAIAEARGKDFYEKYSRPRDSPSAWREELSILGLIGIIPPLLLLIVGWVLAWIFGGFRPEASKTTLSILFSIVAVVVVAVLSWHYTSQMSGIPQIPNASQSSQRAPNLSPPPKTISAWEAWSKTAKSLAPQQLPTAIAPAAAAESINANLCRGSSSNAAAERTLSSAATRELVKYLEGLKKGSYSFNWTISGHDAAKRLGFGHRFAATYSQAVEEVEARLARKSSVHIDEIIDYFSRILREEQTVDRLVGDKDRHFPAVAYLRAMQEGECAFPYVLRDTPTAQTMMNHLARAYPEVKKGFANEPFASIYNATVAYGRNQIKQNGSVSIYRLIEEMRLAIVQSANPNVPTAPSISSEPPSKTPAVPQTKSTGSGFFITQAGHLLTNAHVVSDCISISVKSSSGQAGVAQVIAVEQNNDLALLKLERRTETVAAFRIGRPPRAGESAVVFGFPLAQLLASTGNVTTGVITALAGPLNDPHQMQISAPVQPGNSGGPVLDANGYLIGVVVSRLNAVRGGVPQNVNFAVKASTAANFLDAHGITYRSATGEKALPIPDIAEQARDFSVQVLCQG